MAEPISVVVAVPGGKPVTAVPGERQRAPVRTVNPELVIVEEALTAQSVEFVLRLRAVTLGADMRPRASTIGSIIGDILGNEGTEELMFEKG